MASSNPPYNAPPFANGGFNIAKSQGKGPGIGNTKLNPANAALNTPPASNSNDIMEKVRHLSNRLTFLTTHNFEFRANVQSRLNNLKTKIGLVKDAIKSLPGPSTPPSDEINELRRQLAAAQAAVAKLTNEKATTAQERDTALQKYKEANDAMNELVKKIDNYVGFDFKNLDTILSLVTDIEQEIDSVESEITNRNRGGSGPSGGGGGSGGVPAPSGGGRVGPTSGGGGRVVPGSVPSILPRPPNTTGNPARQSFIDRARNAQRMRAGANAFAGAASGSPVPRPPPAAAGPVLPPAPAGPVLPPAPAPAAASGGGGVTNPLGTRTGGKSKKLRKKQKKKSKTKRRKH